LPSPSTPTAQCKPNEEEPLAPTFSELLRNHAQAAANSRGSPLSDIDRAVTASQRRPFSEAQVDGPAGKHSLAQEKAAREWWLAAEVPMAVQSYLDQPFSKNSLNQCCNRPHARLGSKKS